MRSELFRHRSANIWVYSDEAMEGRAKPIRWGKFTFGQPVGRFTQNQ